MRYQINTTGEAILADEAFMDAHYPGDYTLLPDDAPVMPQRVLSKLGFRNRFTAAEKAAIEFAAIDDPAAALPARMGAAAMRAT